MTDHDLMLRAAAAEVSAAMWEGYAREAQSRAAALEAELAEARKEVADVEAAFRLTWEAQQRAIRAWQDAHPGMEAVWPDHAVPIEWLLGIAFPTPVCHCEAMLPSGEVVGCVREVGRDGTHPGALDHLSADGRRWTVFCEKRP